MKLYPIPGYEGLYSITKTGRVWSHLRNVSRRDNRPYTLQGRWRKPYLDSGGYPYVFLHKEGIATRFKIHRLIGVVFLGYKEGQDTDHINGDKTDNRVENLRLCSRSQNHANKPPAGGTSRFKGVSWDTCRSQWRAEIQIEKRRKFLGRFDSEKDAARVYDDAAKSEWGEFAYLNFP